ncbi:hypothetical protein TRFO_11109 [Tritrichomonas foetus]|uniref:Thioredoxin domain-containing protein n=1 Tax=Tritrichomonas foetus TaxID=1144522 RepID=A0A1J4J5F5_9EUKA|nr:hypothetical protein TRFO_11109 [Tritrichomonas foetus]|eukprot:OHS94486.1 hypothetical protein TRFO_11109 [Tritrichomonas foetus]
MAMLLYLLVTLSLSECFHLNEEVFRKIVSMEDRPPIFIEIWDPWCKNCENFKGDWKRLTDSKLFAQKVVFGDLNCQEEKKLCQEISPGTEFPRFAWFDPDSTIPRPFTGPYSINELAQWVHSQVNGPLEVINDTLKFEKMKHLSLKIPLFKFTVYENDIASIQIIKAAANAVKHFQTKMILSYDREPTDPIIAHYTPDNRVILLQDTFSVNSIIHFVKIHAVRFFIPYNDFVGQYSKVEKMPVMVFAFPHNNSDIRKQAFESAKNVEPLISTSQVCCLYNPKFCRYYGIKERTPAVVILNRDKELFWIHELEGDLFKWTEDVLNGKISGSGPGVVSQPQLRNILLMFYEYRGIGGFRYYLFFLPVLLFVILILMISCVVATSPEKQETNNKAKIN